MEVRYRFATADDASVLADVHTRSWRAAYRGLIDDAVLDGLDPSVRARDFAELLEPGHESFAGRVWIVAEAVPEGDEVEGLRPRILGHTVALMDAGDPTAAELLILYLDPESIASGVGSALHDMALRGLHRLGARSASLQVLVGNDRAISFYERKGWRLTGEASDEDWSGVRVTALGMSIELDVDVLRANRGYWTEKAADYAARQRWTPDIDWGIYGITDEDAGTLFPEVEGLDVVEIGCGTAYVSNWARLRGARNVVGLDPTRAQLSTAQARASENRVSLPLVQGDGHRLPFRDNSFDVAINEYGAAIWCDPRVWIPEAARVLRPGGRIWFLGNSVAFMLCAPEFEGRLASPEFVRPQRDMHRLEWIDTPNVEFHVSHGEMISILTAAGFMVEALHELYVPEETAAGFYGHADGSWASRWPIEEVWVARLPE